jgi:hypothetical protein
MGWLVVMSTMKWTSTTEEFGLVTPDDGGRDIFVRFTPAIAHLRTSANDGESSPIMDLGARTHARHKPTSRVEVRTRYQTGQWARGYEVAQVVDSGYYIRHIGSLEMLPGLFVEADVRATGD